MTEVEDRLPFRLAGLDTDNEGDFIDQCPDQMGGFYIRSRPYKSNDNAQVKQKNGDVERLHAFHYRYDTVVEVRLLNELHSLMRVRLNMLTVTTKAVGWRSNKHGKKTRVFEKPSTPYRRVLE